MKLAATAEPLIRLHWLRDMENGKLRALSNECRLASWDNAKAIWFFNRSGTSSGLLFGLRTAISGHLPS